MESWSQTDPLCLREGGGSMATVLSSFDLTKVQVRIQGSLEKSAKADEEANAVFDAVNAFFNSQIYKRLGPQEKGQVLHLLQDILQENNWKTATTYLDSIKSSAKSYRIGRSGYAHEDVDTGEESSHDIQTIGQPQLRERRSVVGGDKPKRSPVRDRGRPKGRRSDSVARVATHRKRNGQLISKVLTSSMPFPQDPDDTGAGSLAVSTASPSSTNSDSSASVSDGILSPGFQSGSDRDFAEGFRDPAGHPLSSSSSGGLQQINHSGDRKQGETKVFRRESVAGVIPVFSDQIVEPPQGAKFVTIVHPTSLDGFCTAVDIMGNAVLPRLKNRHGNKSIRKAAQELHTTLSAKNNSNRDDQDVTQSRFLYAVGKQIVSAAKVVEVGAFLSERDRDSILLLKEKTSLYPERIYNLIDLAAPFLTAALFFGIYYVLVPCILGHMLTTLPLWLTTFGPSLSGTVGLAFGKDLVSTPALYSRVRTALASIVPSKFFKSLSSIVGNFTELTDKFEPSRSSDYSVTGIDSTITINIEEKPQINDKTRYSEYIAKQENSKLEYFDYPRLFGKTSDKITTLTEELQALERAICSLPEGLQDLKEVFGNLKHDLGAIKTEDDDEKVKFVRRVAQQARFLLEALMFSDNDQEKLDHFLLLKARVASDPAEYHWGVRIITSIAVSLLISLALMAFTSFASPILATYAIDYFCGWVGTMAMSKGELSVKLAMSSTVTAPTGSKMVCDWVYRTFFGSSLNKYLTPIGDKMKLRGEDTVAVLDRARASTRTCRG